NFVDQILSRGKNVRKIFLKSNQDSAHKIAGAGANLDNGPLLRRAEVDVRFHEIVRKGRGEKLTAFGYGPIVARASPADAIASAVVAFMLIVKHRFHPIVKANRTFASDARAQALDERSYLMVNWNRSFHFVDRPPAMVSGRSTKSHESRGEFNRLPVRIFRA